MSHVILVLHSVDGFKYGIEFQSGCLKVMLKCTCIFPSSLDRNNNQLAGFAKNTHKYIDTDKRGQRSSCANLPGMTFMEQAVWRERKTRRAGLGE